MIVETCPSTQKHGDGLAQNSHMFAGIFVKYQLCHIKHGFPVGLSIAMLDLQMTDALVYP